MRRGSRQRIPIIVRNQKYFLPIIVLPFCAGPYGPFTNSPFMLEDSGCASFGILEGRCEARAYHLQIHNVLFKETESGESALAGRRQIFLGRCPLGLLMLTAY
jgi:hypothetical protein